MFSLKSRRLTSMARPLKGLLAGRSRPGGRAARIVEQLEMLDVLARKTVLETEDFTGLTPEKVFALIQAVRHIHRFSIEGDIVECGVWRGGAVMAAALTLTQLEAPERDIYLYDTFSGMTPPTDRDQSMPGTRNVDPAERFRELQTGSDSCDWCCASIEDVKTNLRRVPYNQDRFIFVEGRVEETLMHTRPDSIALLRLDTDWYASTKEEMKYLMPLLVPKGVLIVDDYYRWKGNREAVDEYIDQHNIPILLTRVGNSAIGTVPG